MAFVPVLNQARMAGVLFWQWGMGAENDGDNNIEVSSGDFDFETIVVPTAQAVLQSALTAGTLGTCSQVRQTVSNGLIVVSQP